MLVVDASTAVSEALDPGGLGRLAGRDVVAPPLLWSEACAVLRRMEWRSEIGADLATAALDRLVGGPIARRSPADLYRRAIEVARRLGWARTCDAEYVALALLEGCPLLTRDARLRRGVGHLVAVVGPADL